MKEIQAFRESKVESYFVKQLKQRGAFPWKFVSPGKRGVPDRIIIKPGGAILFVELKAPGEKPTKQQAHRIKEMQAQGCKVYVIDSIRGVDAFMEEEFHGI